MYMLRSLSLSLSLPACELSISPKKMKCCMILFSFFLSALCPSRSMCCPWLAQFPTSPSFFTISYTHTYHSFQVFPMASNDFQWLPMASNCSNPIMLCDAAGIYILRNSFWWLAQADRKMRCGAKVALVAGWAGLG